MKFRITQPFAGSVVFDVEGATKEDVIRQGSSRLARLHLLLSLHLNSLWRAKAKALSSAGRLLAKKGSLSYQAAR